MKDIAAGLDAGDHTGKLLARHRGNERDIIVHQIGDDFFVY